MYFGDCVTIPGASWLALVFGVALARLRVAVPRGWGWGFCEGWACEGLGVSLGEQLFHCVDVGKRSRGGWQFG